MVNTSKLIMSQAGYVVTFKQVHAERLGPLDILFQFERLRTGFPGTPQTSASIASVGQKPFRMIMMKRFLTLNAFGIGTDADANNRNSKDSN